MKRDLAKKEIQFYVIDAWEIAERIGCPLHVYEGFGHSAYEEAPDFNRRIYDFLMQL